MGIGVAVVLWVGDEEADVTVGVTVVLWVGDEVPDVGASVAVVLWVGDEVPNLDNDVLCDVYKIPASTAPTRMTTTTTARMAMMPFFPRRRCGGGKFDPSAGYVNEEGML